MRYADRESWLISEDQGWDLTVALYVRDAAGLDSPGDLATPPPLEPAVNLDAALDRFTDRLPASWRAWWTALLQQQRTASPADDPRERIRRTAPSAEFGALLDEVLPSAYTWAEAQKAEHIRQFQGQTRPQRLAINQIVDSVEQSLGRTVQPFRLRMTTLPVSGIWSQQVSAEEFLVSRHLRNNLVELDRFLRPVITALA